MAKVLLFLLVSWVAQSIAAENVYRANIATVGETGLQAGSGAVRLERSTLLSHPLAYLKGSYTLTVVTPGTEQTYMIPKSFWRPKGDFSVPANMTDQNASLNVKRIERVLSEEERTFSEICQYTGYCISCGIGLDGSSSCGYKHSAMCDGRRDVLRKVKQIEQQLQLKIIGRRGSSSITTNAVVVEEVGPGRALNTCK